jgi:hypothetical protein
MTVFVKQCNASEPSTYVVNYAGAIFTDCSVCSIMEVTGSANLQWLDAIDSTTSVSSPDALITAVGQLVVLCFAGDGAGAAPPTGFGLQVSTTDFTVGNGTTAIATVFPSAMGTYSPGAWMTTSITGIRLWTLVFGC